MQYRNTFDNAKQVISAIIHNVCIKEKMLSFLNMKDMFINKNLNMLIELLYSYLIELCHIYEYN